MTWNSASMPIQGFTVFQTAPGAVLSFVPAMGTVELDQLIDAYVVDAATIQEKRAIVSMEFFTHNALTNQFHLFFPVINSFSYVSAVTDSPASSFNDSGYGSTFNVSPMSQESLASPVSSGPATPFTALQPAGTQRKNRVSKSKAKVSNKTTSTTSRAFTHDFSDMPGMKILTKEGVDVTNSARGGKTKEDREHAHLIRLLKSCPSCKKKKVRCDPSHKREFPQKQVVAQSQPVIKPRNVGVPSPSLSQFGCDIIEAQAGPKNAPPVDVFAGSVDFDFSLLGVADFDGFLNMGPHTADTTDYSFLMDDQAMFTPTTASRASPAFQSYANFSPAQSFVASSNINARDDQPAQLPYLQLEGHNDNYVDFALFSPAASPLGEEPQELHSVHPSPSHEESQQPESPQQHGSSVLGIPRPASEFVGRPRSSLSPITTTYVPIVTLAVGSESGRNLVDSVLETMHMKSGPADPGQGGSSHDGSCHFGRVFGGEILDGVAAGTSEGLETLHGAKTQHSGASTHDGVRATDTIASEDHPQSSRSARLQCNFWTLNGCVLSKDTTAREKHTRPSQSTQLQRVASNSAVRQLQPTEQTTPHKKQSWYTTSYDMSVDVCSTTSDMNIPIVKAKSTASEQRLLKTPRVQNIPKTYDESIRNSPSSTVKRNASRQNIATSRREADARTCARKQSWSHSAPLSSITHTAVSGFPTRFDTSICTTAMDMQSEYSWGSSRIERHRLRQNGRQQTLAAGGTVRQRTSTAATSGILTNDGRVVVTQMQDPRSTTCSPPHVPCATEYAMISSNGLDKIDSSMTARRQNSSDNKSATKKTTNMKSSTSSNVTMTLGKPNAGMMPIYVANSTLLLALDAVFIFAALLQSLHDSTMIQPKLAMSITLLVLQCITQTSSSQSSLSTFLSRIRKQTSTASLRAAGRFVFI